MLSLSCNLLCLFDFDLVLFRYMFESLCNVPVYAVMDNEFVDLIFSGNRVFADLFTSETNL